MTLEQIKEKYMVDSMSSLSSVRQSRRGTDFQSLKKEYIELGGDPKKINGASRQALILMVEKLRKQKGVKG